MFLRSCPCQLFVIFPAAIFITGVPSFNPEINRLNIKIVPKYFKSSWGVLSPRNNMETIVREQTGADKREVPQGYMLHLLLLNSSHNKAAY